MSLQQSEHSCVVTAPSLMIDSMHVLQAVHDTATMWLDRCPLTSAPGFDAKLGINYDSMHTLSGVIKDTLVKCPQFLRTSAVTRQYDIEHNKKYVDDADRPWQETIDDHTGQANALQVTNSTVAFSWHGPQAKL
jgi:hypothetical protein